MNAALLTFSVTGLGVLLQFFTRRRHLLASLLSSAFAFFIAIFVLSIPMDRAFTLMGTSIRFSSTWQIFGRSFILDPFNRQAVGFLYLAGGTILGSAWISRPTRMFHPLGLAILGLVAASLMVVPFLFAAIFLELAAITSLLILSRRRIGTARGGLRLLTLYTLAMLAILFAGSIADLGGISELAFSLQDDRISILLAFGFAILLSIPPFHSWLAIAARETHPLAIVFAATILQAAGLFFILRFLSAFSFTANETELLERVRIFGATTVWVAALWAASQKRFEKMAAYAIVSDLGVMLVAIGIGTAQGYRLALIITAARFVGSLCLALGLSSNAHGERFDRENSVRIGPAFPASSLGRLASYLGAASLAGLPLTAGFPAKWELLQILTGGASYVWISLLLGMAILGFRLLRFALDFKSIQITIDLDPKIMIILSGAILLIFGIGLVPWVLGHWIERTIMGLGLIVP